jgi:hypothetical protein
VIWLFKWLFFGHVHTWETIGIRDFRTTDAGKVVDIGERHIQQCKTCGIVIKRDLI